MRGLRGISATLQKCYKCPDLFYSKSEYTTPATPYCCRFEDLFKSIKIYQFLTIYKGTKKFNRGDPEYSLQAYSDEIRTHMEQSGMDSVFYFVDPCDSSSRYSILKYHSRFSKEDIRKQMETYSKSGTKPSYDRFDRDNHGTSRVYILDSLDETLK